LSLSLSLPLPRIARLSTLLVATLLAPVAAFASVGLNKSFAPTNVSAGQTSTLTVILLNSNAAPATAVAFTDTLPGSVVVANPANASTTCVGGSVTATPGNSSFSFSGGTIPAAAAGVAGQCSMQVSVVSPTAGVYINTIPSGAVSSSQGTNPQNASATLTVAALRPVTGAKAFLPTNLHGNGTASTVTITLTNPNGVALTSAAFTDTLPAGLAVASPANTSTTCVGGTVSTGATSASLAAGTIPANGNCNVKFDVVASAPNVYVDGNVTNTIAAGALTTAQGVTNPVFSNTVRLQTGARVEKSFAPTPIVTGGTSTLTVTVRNFNATAQTGIAFTDTMPAGMTVAAPVTTGGTCTPPLAFTPVPIAGANAFTVSGGTLPAAGAGVANANCTVTINVIGTNAGVNPVTLTNTIPVGNFSGVAYSSAGAGLVVNAVTSVGGSKSFAPATILQGQVSTMTITLTNSAAVPATITSFTDALTTLGASPQFSVAASPAATTTCGGVLNAAPGATTVTLGAGNSIPAAGNCTIIVPVQASATASTGARTNTIAQGALVTNQGRTQAAITGALTVNPVLSVAKAFAPATVAAGADTRLTITLTRAAGASALSGLAFTDTLPAAHLVSASPNLVNNCGGAVTANSGTGTVVLAGGGLAGGAAATSCTILVNITTPSGSAGAPTNTIAAGAVTSTEGFINPAAASAVITRVLTNVTLNKSFSPTSVLVGGTSTLTINVINTNANALAITGGALTDALPVGMIIATPPAATNSCGGALTAVAGASSLSLANGSIAANATCTITVNVVTNASGNLTNTLGAGAFTSAQGVTNPLPASATLAATGVADLAITKTDGVATVTPGSTTTYTIVAKNNGPNAVAGAGVVDTPPAGVTFTGWTCVASAGSACNASGSGPINELVTLLNGGTATFTVTAAIAPGATGSITNTATVVAPATVVDTNAANNTASDTDTLVPVTSLAIGKTDGSATYTPGTGATYTITVTNAGPSDATSVTLADTLPAGVTQSAGATCIAGPGANCGAITNLGSGFSVAGAYVPASGSSLVYTVPVSFGAGMVAASITNSVTVTNAASSGAGSTATATDTDTLALVSDVAITKTDGSPTYTPGNPVTYTIVASNAGPSPVVGATVADTVPAAITSPTWTCVASAGSSCPASGSGNIGASVNLLVGGTATFTLTGIVLPAATGNLVNTATVSVPGGVTDPNPGNNSATDTDTANPIADLAVTKTDGQTSVNAGATTTYTITVTNNGPSAVTGATVSDPLPAGVASFTWTCAATAGSSCPASGSGAIGTSAVNLLASGVATFTVTATISGTATGSIVNVVTATVPPGTTDPIPGNNTATDTDTVSLVADLAITKTDGSPTYTPGNAITYTIVASNNGPSGVTGATVADAVPAAITAPTWTCVASVGSACGAPSGSGNIGTTVDLLNGGTATFTLTGTVSAGATGNLVNTATVAVPPGTTDPTPGNNTATDTDTANPIADLAITKTDGSATYTPGNAITYTIVASNSGPSAVTGATVADAVPAAITAPTWTCVASAGSSCAASGSGNINTPVNLLVGGTATFTLTGTVSASATGNLVNTATVTVPSGTTDPTPGNNTATDTDTPNPIADLAITKTDGSATYTPGNAITYTIVASNSGPSAVTGATVADTIPAVITAPTWTCVASAGSSCPASGSGNIGALVNLLPSGTATFTLTGTVSASATGNLVNTATVTVPSGTTDPTPGNNSATDTDTANPIADLAITKTDGSATYTPGNAITYTIVASNSGPSAVTGATVADTIPAAITSPAWTCVASAGSSCPASGSGNIGALVNLLPSGTATFTLTGTVSAGATGNLVNTATVAVPPGTTDPTPGNNSATDTDTANPIADLAITKTDGSATYTPGNAITYTIVASNSGPSAVTGATVADTVPAAITAPTWTCVASAGSSCPASGSGNIGASVNLLVGGTATFTLTGTVSAGATGNLVNTATVAVPPGTTDPTPGNNSATDTDTPSPVADLAITKTDGASSATAGAPITYTIVASNSGPSAVNGATVADTLPATITGATWTCVASAGSSCAASGSGNINTPVNLLVGGTTTFTLTGTVSAGATGNLVNTATVAVPPGTTDPNPGNNSATDVDTLVSQVALTLAKTDGSPSYTPGGTATYTITVGNGGPSTATSVTLTDPLPAGVTLTANASCVASGTANCGTVTGSTGQTSLGTTGASIGAGAGNSLVFTAPVAFASGMTTDPLVNTATATDLAASGPGSTATGSDSDTRSAVVTLAVTKDDGATTYTPGSTATYAITVQNTGTSDALDVTVADALPPGVTLAANATCSANGTSSCGTVTGTTGQTTVGATGAHLVPGGANTIVFLVPVTFDPAMSANPLVNTASATDVPTGSNASGQDSDTLSADVTLAATKDDGSATYTPGGTATYTVTVSNTGISDALNVTVADPFPAGMTLSASATCVANGTSNCGSVTGTTGQPSFGTTGARIDAGTANSLVFTVPVAFAPSMSASPLVNTAAVTDVASGNTTSASDSDTLAPQVTLAVTKDDGSATYTPGGTATYTVTVANTGLSDALNATVTDPLPAGVMLSASATCVANGTSSCGTVTGTTGQASFGTTTARINAGAANSLVFTVPVAFAASMTTNPLINTATATDIPTGTTANGTDSDVLAANVVLAVAKTDGSPTYTPGGGATYTVTIANTGLTDALDVTVADPLPAGVTLSGNVTCVANGTSACGIVSGTTGQGSFGAATARVNAGGANTLAFSVPVAFASGMTTNPLVNTASATDNTSGSTASGSDSDALSDSVSLVVTKTDGSATYTPGTGGTYTVTVTNTGISDAVNVTVADALPAGVTLSASATCVATGTSTCGTVSGTTGQSAFGTTGARINAGAGNALTFTVPVLFASAMTTDPLVNTATATDVASGATGTGTDSDTLAASAGLGITKTDGSATYTPGGTATYTIVVSNAGPSAANSVTVTDALPAGVTLAAAATCVPTGVATCGAVVGAAGAGAFGTTGATIAAGVGNRLTFTVPVNFAPGMIANPLVNTVSASDPAAGAPVSASDSDVRQASADVGVVKTGPATIKPGAAITYTLLITNAGPSPADGAMFMDNVPGVITGVAASCGSAAGGASCGTVNVSGNSVSGTVPVLPVGGSVVITITGTVTGATTFTNTATVSPPPGTLDPNPGNSSSSATTSGVVGASPVPVDAPWALALLAMLLALAGARQATRARVRRR